MFMLLLLVQADTCGRHKLPGDSREVTAAKSSRHPCFCEKGGRWTVFTQWCHADQAQHSSTLLALTQPAGPV